MIRRVGPTAAAGGDEGFTMLEVVVSMVAFAVMVTAALGIITNTLDVVRSGAHRVAAANLATKQIESARSQLAIDIPDGAISRAETVAGTTYTVTQDANYVASGSSTSACVGTGDQLSYKLVTVTVTWPSMGSVKPVRSDTLKALGVGAEGLDPTLGALAVGVFGATGNPVADVTVALSPGGQAQTTGIDGCAVFVGLATGPTATSTIDYTASVDQPGHVASANSQAAQVVQGVQAGRIAQTQLLYDVERTIDVQIAVPLGHTAPVGLPLRFRNSYFDSGSTLPACGGSTGPVVGCLAALPGSATHLFPAVYEFWVGSCIDAKTSDGSFDATTADGVAPVSLAGTRVDVQNSVGEVIGASVTATHAADADVSGCPSGETWELPDMIAGGSLGALPYGTWTITTPGGTSEIVTLAAGDPVLDVLLTVTP